MTNKSVPYETGPMVDELAELSANARSVRVGIAQMVAMGRLGALAKELQRLAEDTERALAPPKRRGRSRKV